MPTSMFHLAYKIRQSSFPVRVPGTGPSLPRGAFVGNRATSAIPRLYGKFLATRS